MKYSVLRHNMFCPRTLLFVGVTVLFATGCSDITEPRSATWTSGTLFLETYGGNLPPVEINRIVVLSDTLDIADDAFIRHITYAVGLDSIPIMIRLNVYSSGQVFWEGDSIRVVTNKNPELFRGIRTHEGLHLIKDGDPKLFVFRLISR